MTQELHRLLRRQLRRHGLELDALADDVRALLDAVNRSYLEADDDRLLVERSLDLSSQELLASNAQLHESEERFRTFAENSADGIIMVNEEGRIVMANAMAERMFGYAETGLVGHTTEELVPESLRAEHSRYRTGFFSQAGRAKSMAERGNLQACRRDASEFPAEISLIPLPTTGARLVAAVIRDITDRKSLEDQLRYQAFHDVLTGLANRARFTDRLEHAIERAGRIGTDVALLFLDIDDFKSINDSMGHTVGDVALGHFAKRLQGNVRPGDTAARLGGDEFAVLLEDSSLDEAVRLARRIIESLATPISLRGEGVPLHASIGIAAERGNDTSADVLLRNADIALYAAKDRGKARYEVYRPSMRAALMERLTLVRDLERALARGEIVVEYQPILELASADIVGFEALVRWDYPKLGRLQPADFIDLAEESGLIVPLGQHVLEVACAQAARWQQEHPHDPPRTMSVNVSAKQLQHEGFVQSLQDVLARTGLAPGCLVLEVTETVMLRDAPAIIVLLHTIRSHGVRVAIDDFGTGYSSLSYLSSFPFDILKIDKAFIDQQRSSERDGVLARVIIDLGKSFSAEVIAEGIEDQKELDLLRSLGCERGQGFYFARPGSAEQVGDLLRAGSGATKAA